MTLYYSSLINVLFKRFLGIRKIILRVKIYYNWSPNINDFFSILLCMYKKLTNLVLK